MINQYETVFILTPVLSDKQVEETVSKIESFLKESKGEIIHKENWGLKKLAYSIQNKKNGFYTLIEFKADTSLIQKLETLYKRDERILRHLIVKMDKHHLAYVHGLRKKETVTE